MIQVVEGADAEDNGQLKLVFPHLFGVSFKECEYCAVSVEVVCEYSLVILTKF